MALGINYLQCYFKVLLFQSLLKMGSSHFYIKEEGLGLTYQGLSQITQDLAVNI